MADNLRVEEGIDRSRLQKAPAGCTGGYRPKQVGGVPVEPCKEGYTISSYGGSVWCCGGPTKTIANTSAEKTAGATTSEPSAFSWSPGQQSTFTQLLERVGSLLRQPTGMTDAERSQLTSYVTRGIKAPLAGELQGVEEAYGRAGLVGSPAMISEQEKVRRDIRKQVAEARTKLAIDEQQQRYERETGGLSAAGGLLTQTAAMEKAVEEANAARRGEGRESVNQLLSLFSTLFGASSANYSNIMQAIMGRIGGGTQSSSSFADWLPYLGYLGGQKLEGNK